MTTPAGWYPDPSGAGGRRYFDGVEWADRDVTVPVKKRPVWPWAVAGVLLLLLGGCGTFLVMESDRLSSIVASARTPTTGDPVTDGSLRFVVTGVNDASMQSDPPPKGVYVIAAVTVTNVGDESRSFVAQNQRLTDAAGHDYPAIGMGVVSAKRETTTEVVNPGQVIEVAMRFDVPKEPKATAIELHESATSGGATVRL